MKLTSFVGTGSGKLGGSVFTVRGGEQIVRAYQPKVLNPKSAVQRVQRAKWKAAVQLSAVLGDVLYPFKQDAPSNVSARNRFVQSLFSSGALSFDETNQQAVVDRSKILLSPSKIAWRYSSDLNYSGSTITGSVTVFNEVVGKGAVLTVVVLHNERNGQPAVTAIRSFDVGQVQVTVNVSTSEPMATDDTVLMVLAVPEDAKMANAYRDVLWSQQESAYILPVVMSEYASAFRYLRGYNSAITIA